MDRTCSEFRRLQEWLFDHADFDLGDMECYAVHILARKGEMFREIGNRQYLCHDPKRCLRILRSLTDKDGDDFYCTIREYDDYDETALNKGYKQEVEGIVTVYPEIHRELLSGKTVKLAIY